LPDELARVDGLLDDPVFFAPFVPLFDPRVGRPSTPMAVYLRMVFLKFRFRLGYESLCREVGDSITWRRFCRIPIDGKVPHPTTLMKLERPWPRRREAGGWDRGEAADAQRPRQGRGPRGREADHRAAGRPGRARRQRRGTAAQPRPARAAPGTGHGRGRGGAGRRRWT